MASEMLALGRNELHIWLTSPESIRDRDLLTAYGRLMNEEERHKQQRFHFARDRHQCLVTRALVRSTLSRYIDLPPETWRFAINDYGRPDLAPGQSSLDLRFNLSHTDGLIACAVTLGREIGVDLESTDRKGETIGIADRFFSASEVRDLHTQPAAAQRGRFFEYWTLKEAYIKARGMGLALPLGHFSFHLDEGAPIRISFDPRLADDPTTWQFDLFRPTSRHLLAVGARRGGDTELSIELRETVPLIRP